ncbi:MAG: anhydro-N-acetylmuramic acid kinase [Synechococcaceae bacterium WB6_3A_227]|nr:anhydro-N-acetylmuramic acid kinase [Synechococcaceae bacterium WB6_3A_227]
MGLTVLGLMSGTSADGVDGVLVRFWGRVNKPQWQLLSSGHHPYPIELQEQIIAAGQGQPLSAASFLQLEQEITNAQAICARLTDPSSRAQLVGCHGQTLWHQPPQGECLGASWQCLNAARLAEILQRPVVSNFRAADLARGGHGAPLVPTTDRALIPSIGGWRGVLNLGGIANITLLPPAQGPDQAMALQGWDCGPANSLIDLAVVFFSCGAKKYDSDGSWALAGEVNEPIVQEWLTEPYFKQPPPKSTGRELFGRQNLEQRLKQLEQVGVSAAEDVIATLTAFSAAAVAVDLARGVKPLELLVSGGGCRNQALMLQLQKRCPGVWVRPLAELGIPDQQREALAFALLAWWQQRGVAAGLPSVTGASRQGLLGVVVHP